MAWKIKKQKEELPKQVVVKTNRNFYYVFDLAKKRIIVVITKGVLGGHKIDSEDYKEVKEAAKNFLEISNSCISHAWIV